MRFITTYSSRSRFALSAIFIAFSLRAAAQTAVHADSITVAIEPTYDKVTGVHRRLLGESYRQLWAAPVKLRIFHLASEKGGLTILQKGGGLQTKSLRMQDATGQQWVLRTIQKYPERGLPPALRPTIAKDILQDQVSTSHPYAALTVPPLAQALGVPHANPQVVYVPDDPALGEYRQDFANQVFLFEEREPLDADKTDNTEKAQQRLQKDNDNRVDQQLVLRARLLDMLLGDYDRHEDQWRWARTKGPKGSLYEPVPRDRDHVYYKPSGALPSALSLHLLMANVQGYSDHIRSINRWNAKASTFDRYFLNALSEEDWKTQIAYVQQHLPDSLIYRALRQMPPNIYRLSGSEIAQKLIGRRNRLDRQALRYYRFLARTVDIPASDKRESVEVTHLPQGQVQVTIAKLKKEGGGRGDVLYQRTFDPADTHELRLYGLGGEDSFAVTGAARSPIRVRLVGGADADVFAVGKEVPQKRKVIIYDRSDEANTLPATSLARIHTSADTTINAFNKASFRYSYLQPLLLAGYSKDYGFQLIGNFIYQHQGFRKDPYASRQNLLVNYGFGNSSLLLNYTGDFKRAIGHSDLSVNVLSKGPNYNNNFFGVGNETEFVNAGNRRIRYYRSIYNLLSADVRLSHTYQHWRLSAGITGQYYTSTSAKNGDRYLSAYAAEHPSEEVFNSQTYAGVVAGATFDTRDRELVAHRGVYWTTSLLGMNRLDADRHTFGQALTEFTFYANPLRDSSLVIANRTGAGTTLGDAAYFQQLKLGGAQNLRGFYLWRFTGKSMVYNNLELRFKLLDFTSYLLPGTLGLVVFNDVGRVWSPNESSQQWHDGYGGGLYFLPAQLLLVQAVVGFSKEGAYPYISAGFRF
ncbi:BamA/TamA family outer membrane protein [Hymenobacter sp. HMF4947]|uniref:BamA/TamA family outer membrane protein n=1 Tax=Hymenobacter ginkgonis TaxID=2682976 RepID=A0A7K1TIQ8_9BACT|nr:BamA/TamA family outer membrane protein [Hymenobacter ginkgonis]MVN78262.1 BamA/TamA family outer membrane protein [Hymenobacter ginkgonis]